MYITLKAEVNIKGSADIGAEVWDNSTISLYRTQCGAPYYWVHTSFTGDNWVKGTKVKFLVNPDGGACQVKIIHN